MSIIKGVWVSLNALSYVSNYLDTHSSTVHCHSDGYPQVFPNFPSFQAEIPSSVPVDEYGNEPIYAVYSEKDLSDRVAEIRMEMFLAQMEYMQKGKCLRSFASEAIVRPVSRPACDVLQFMDRMYMNIAFIFERVRRCYQGEKSLFCTQIKQTTVLADITDSLTFELDPAEELIAEALGEEKEDLIGRREELRFRTRATNRTSALFV